MLRQPYVFMLTVSASHVVNSVNESSVYSMTRGHKSSKGIWVLALDSCYSE